MSLPTKQSFLGLIASGLSSIFGTKRIGHTTADLKKAEFKSNTQRLGIRFNEKIRNTFRFKWIRKKNGRA